MSTNVIDLRHALKRGRCSHDETDSKAHNARHCLMTWSKLSDVFLPLPVNTLLVLLFRHARVVIVLLLARPYDCAGRQIIGNETPVQTLASGLCLIPPT